jgi:CheY-like chemotaxis protein
MSRSLENLQVLLVEDEPDMVDLLLWMLEDARCHVRIAYSAEEALTLLKDYQPDVLVCNIKLPNQNGKWLIQQIRASSQPHLPAIAVSSYEREVTQQSVFDAGFQHFLGKPFTPDELTEAILRLVKSNSSRLPS